MSEQRIASLSDLPTGTLRLVKAGDKRLAVVRTGDGVFALDNACPHQGYALVQGELKDGTVTCHWHNWKFRMRDGACVLGEESVRSYPIRIEGDDVIADLTDPSDDEIRPRLLASLRRGIERHEVGRMSRDVVRLLRAATNPAELVWEAVAYGAPRAEYGWGHALATATDCLALVDRYEGDARALPIMQGIAGITESELRRPLRPQPRPATSLPHDARAAFRAAVEGEDVDVAEALVLAAIDAGYDQDELTRWFVESVSDHHLGYGHMAIYTQKAFELVGKLGWDRAATVLPHLVPAVVYGTREDKLPYMRPFMKALATLDIEKLANVDADPAWRDDDRVLRDALLGPDKQEPVRAVERAILDGAGVDGVLDAVVATAAERMLRYDVRLDFDPHVEFAGSTSRTPSPTRTRCGGHGTSIPVPTRRGSRCSPPSRRTTRAARSGRRWRRMARHAHRRWSHATTATCSPRSRHRTRQARSPSPSDCPSRPRPTNSSAPRSATARRRSSSPRTS